MYSLKIPVLLLVVINYLLTDAGFFSACGALYYASDDDRKFCIICVIYFLHMSLSLLSDIMTVFRSITLPLPLSFWAL